jgi:transcriptional regulator with XRE-family HTH domain
MQIAFVGRFKHGGLVQLLHEHGWTQAEFARQLGVGQSVVSQWMLLKDVPRGPTRVRLEALTGLAFDTLFPAEVLELLTVPLPREIIAMREMSVTEIREAVHRHSLPSAETALLAGEASELLAETVSRLPALQREVIVRTCGLDGAPAESLTHIGHRHGVSHTRVSQIYAQALRALRHPSRYPAAMRDALHTLIAAEA